MNFGVGYQIYVCAVFNTQLSRHFNRVVAYYGQEMGVVGRLTTRRKVKRD